MKERLVIQHGTPAANGTPSTYAFFSRIRIIMPCGHGLSAPGVALTNALHILPGVTWLGAMPFAMVGGPIHHLLWSWADVERDIIGVYASALQADELEVIHDVSNTAPPPPIMGGASGVNPFNIPPGF